MGRKRVLRFPKTATFKCPKCEKTSRIKVPQDSCLYFWECKRCKERISTPPARCCIICSYTDKRCPAAMKREFEAANRK